MSELNQHRRTPSFPGESILMDHWVSQVAQQYRDEGYGVILHPGLGVLPGFAQGHDIDLMANKGDERVLVQIKARRQDLQTDTRSIKLAEAVNRQPGWRFDLVVINADSESDKVVASAKEPAPEKIETSLSRAEQLWNSGDEQLSCVLSWAALEAAMRHAVRVEGIELENGSPSFLLRALYSRGIIAKKEFERLNEAAMLRNAVVHGMVPPAISPSVSQEVVAVARRLLSRNGKQPAA